MDIRFEEDELFPKWKQKYINSSLYAVVFFETTDLSLVYGGGLLLLKFFRAFSISHQKAMFC